MKYMSVKQIAESGEYPFTVGQLRDWLLHRDKNGLDAAVRVVGKRLYFNMEEFDKWVEKSDGRVLR
jgi:hypothetical protein